MHFANDVICTILCVNAKCTKIDMNSGQGITKKEKETKNEKDGTWNMEHGTWNMEHRTWNMEHGTCKWNMQMEH
jgi:hypothetical protein